MPDSWHLDGQSTLSCEVEMSSQKGRHTALTPLDMPGIANRYRHGLHAQKEVLYPFTVTDVTEVIRRLDLNSATTIEQSEHATETTDNGRFDRLRTLARTALRSLWPNMTTEQDNPAASDASVVPEIHHVSDARVYLLSAISAPRHMLGQSRLHKNRQAA